MAQRSPYNDRYKTDQKGKTRRSASAAKPKRAIADVTPAESAKKPAAKRGLFSRGNKPAKAAPIAVPMTPEIAKMRRLWWILWSAALGIAVIILALQQYHLLPFLVVPLWVAWAAAMGGAFWLEFVPLRKARQMAIDHAKTAPKGGRPSKPSKPAVSDNEDVEDDADEAGKGGGA
jgi:hypothetical protein